LAAGGTITAGTFLSNGGTSGTTADVYPIMVVAQEAWGQVSLKGMNAIQPIYLPAKQITHANPMGQFGYVGANFYKNAVRLNENWMVRIEAAASALYYMPFMTPRGLVDAYERYNQVIREVTRETGALLIDGETDIPGDPQHFTDSVHFTDAGSRAMATRISGALARSPEVRAVFAR
jgi:hypothetical protein